MTHVVFGSVMVPAGALCEIATYKGVSIALCCGFYTLDGSATSRGMRGGINRRSAWKAAKAEINAKLEPKS